MIVTEMRHQIRSITTFSGHLFSAFSANGETVIDYFLIRSLTKTEISPNFWLQSFWWLNDFFVICWHDGDGCGDEDDGGLILLFASLGKKYDKWSRSKESPDILTELVVVVVVVVEGRRRGRIQTMCITITDLDIATQTLLWWRHWFLVDRRTGRPANFSKYLLPCCCRADGSSFFLENQ